MKILTQFVPLLVLLVALTGCATTRNYVADRGRDAADIFTWSVGLGAGAKARVGPIQAGALLNIDMMGLRGGAFGEIPWYEATEDALLPFPNRINKNRSGCLFGRERFADPTRAGKHITVRRGKGFTADAPLPIIGIADQPEYYTEIEVVIGAAGSLRLGFNPGELVDFILGWTTIDIYGDDLEARQTKKESNHVPVDTARKLADPQH